MILESDHVHSVQHSEKPKSYSQVVWEQMLKESKSAINSQTSSEIRKMLHHQEQKIYLSYSKDPRKYIEHMGQKNGQQNKNKVLELLVGRQDKIHDQIVEANIEISPLNQKQRMKQIREELKSKLTSVKEVMRNFSLSQLSEEKRKELESKHLQFRRKGYWKEKSQKNQEVRKFILRMQNQRKQIQASNEKERLKEEKRRKQSQEKRKLQKQEEMHQVKSHIFEKRQRVKSQRKKDKEHHQKKQQQNQIFVRKYKKKPVYLINEEKFKKQVVEPAQAERKRKLAEIRKDKKPIDAEGLQLHQQWYQEMKEKNLAFDEKRQQFRQINERNIEKLKELYHGKFHEKIQQQLNSYQAQMQEKKKIKDKISSYSENVKENHRPKFSPKKKRQLSEKIQQLNEKAFNGKKKVINDDGSISFEEITFERQRQIGVSYLEHLRKFNEGKKKKEERSSSMMELTKKPQYPNYLQQIKMKPKEQAEYKTNWKKILKNQQFSDRQKYTSVIGRVKQIQNQAKQKQLQLKYLKDEGKAVDMKKKLDECYIDSLSAKMGVLKDVILKQ